MSSVHMQSEHLSDPADSLTNKGLVKHWDWPEQSQSSAGVWAETLADGRGRAGRRERDQGPSA